MRSSADAALVQLAMVTVDPRSVMPNLLVILTLTFLFSTTSSSEGVNGSPSKHRQKREDFVCPEADGLYADPETCRRFYICSGYYPFTQNCPSSLYFDDIKKFCTRKTKDLVCGPVETPPTVPPTIDPATTTECDPATCVLPDCFCSADGTLIPGNVQPADTPQMILLSFDGAVNSLNYDHYMGLLRNRTNPNGCPIKATFFVSHEYNSNFLVQKLYAEGHEIAINSISHRYPEEWWAKANYENLTEEMVGMREILHRFSNISRDSLLGARVPFLHAGGNAYISMIYDYGFVYDSSLAVPMGSVPLWPYTLDHKIPHRCMHGKCPTHAYPGLWEIPLNTLFSEDGTGGMCALADQCVFQEGDEESVEQFLEDNFNRHYKNNRAPLGLALKVNWFNDKEKSKILYKFFDKLLSKHKDVWFVTMQQAVTWMRTPTTLSNINSFASWACEKREKGCNLPNNCPLPFVTFEGRKEVRYLQTCVRCPVKYPWVGNFEGAKDGKKISDITRELEGSKQEET